MFSQSWSKLRIEIILHFNISSSSRFYDPLRFILVSTTFLRIKLSVSNLLHDAKWCLCDLKNECVHPTLNTVFSTLATILLLFAYKRREKSLCQKAASTGILCLPYITHRLGLSFLMAERRGNYIRLPAAKSLKPRKLSKIY